MLSRLHHSSWKCLPRLLAYIVIRSVLSKSARSCFLWIRITTKKGLVNSFPDGSINETFDDFHSADRAEGKSKLMMSWPLIVCWQEYNYLKRWRWLVVTMAWSTINAIGTACLAYVGGFNTTWSTKCAESWRQCVWIFSLLVIGTTSAWSRGMILP